MWRVLGLTLAAGLAGCSNLIPTESCTLGRSRSVSVTDTTGALSVDLSLIEYDPGVDEIGWVIRITGMGDDVTAIRLQLRTPGMPDRMVLDLTRPDQDPGPDFAVGIVDNYSTTDSIENLMSLVRSGMTYIDVQLGSDPDRILRYDISNAQYRDWFSLCGLD